MSTPTIIFFWLIDFSLTQLTEPEVEFFDPNIRSELERRDAEIVKKSGKGAAPGGDEWVWLTSYSRVPVRLIYYNSLWTFKNFLFLFYLLIDSILISNPNSYKYKHEKERKKWNTNFNIPASWIYYIFYPGFHSKHFYRRRK